MAKTSRDGADRAQTHPLANELADVPVEAQAEQRRSHAADNRSRRLPQVREDVPPSDETGNRPALRGSERVVGRAMIAFVVGAIVIGLGVAAAAFRNWFALVVAAVVFFAYALVLMAPAWLAISTKAAQDEAVRQQRQPPRA